MLVATSCARAPVSDVAAVPPADAAVGQALPLAARATGRVTLAHDFGVLRPAASAQHEFTLRNDTGTPWTFARFLTSCGCTVAEISDAHIPPGGATRVTVSYRATEALGDDRRVVGVEFNEPGVPAISLEIKAKVREPVNLFPALLRVEAGYDRPATAHIEVCSYLEGATAPALLADADWATVGPAEVAPLPADDPAMRGHWRVPVTLAADRLGPGEYRCEVATPPGTTPAARAGVQLRVAAPVAVSPGQLFFGAVTAGRPASVTFSVRRAAGGPPGGVTAEHDLGPGLVVETVSVTVGVTVMRATLTPRAAGELSGAVTVKIPGLPATRVPVLARVLADGP